MKRWHFITNFETGEVTQQEIPEGVDAREFMQQQLDDCPLCQQARARGEQPVIHSGPLPTMRAPKRWPRATRWRKRKGGGTR
jgi:hypothetical protein